MKRWIARARRLLRRPAAPLPEAPEAFLARTAWWREARLGLFVHWGLYALPADSSRGPAEWYMHDHAVPRAEYEKLAGRFRPTSFNARAWARLARAAGAGYLVFTAKHHDGFCMYDSPSEPYNVVRATPFGRDPARELAEACRAEGIRLGLYYSLLDWHHPDANEAGAERYVRHVKRQLRELVEQYEPALLWFDGEWGPWWSEARGRGLERFLRSLDGRLLVNNRVGRRGFTEGDYSTPEQAVPPAPLGGRLWESCLTINDTWGFSRNDHNWKSSEELIRCLAECAGKGGNLLLNVGPDEQGLVPAPCVERLEALGHWLRAHGEGVRGTARDPFRHLRFEGASTARGDRLHLHVFRWPAEGAQVVGLKNAVRAVCFLEDGSPARYTASAEEDGTPVLTVLPPARPNAAPTGVMLTLDGPPEVVAPDPIPAGPGGAFLLRAVDADIHGGRAYYENAYGEDCLSYWIDPADYISWPIRAPASATYEVEVTYACADQAAGSAFTVAAGPGTRVAGAVCGTGGWTSFQDHSLGRLTLAPGRHALVVRALTMPRGAVMNLRSVRLTPVPESPLPTPPLSLEG